MCWEMDYKFFAEQKKAQETRIKEEQRAGVIDKLLSEANKQSETPPPVKEVGACKVDSRLRLTELVYKSQWLASGLGKIELAVSAP